MTVQIRLCTFLNIEDGDYCGEYMKIGSEWWQLYSNTWEACYDEQPLEAYLAESNVEANKRTD